MMQCKRCQSEQVIRNGRVWGKLRYCWKECRYNVTERDKRKKENLVVKKVLGTLFYSIGTASFSMLGKLLNVHFFNVSLD